MAKLCLTSAEFGCPALEFATLDPVAADLAALPAPATNHNRETAETAICPLHQCATIGGPEKGNPYPS